MNENHFLNRTYEIEETFLSEYAFKSKCTAGRTVSELECPLRTPFQRDRDRIIHSKAFRRLKNKTQVFLNPSGDHYRTRMTHTLDVAQIARSISRVLALNEDLTEAIALGHDLGHTPFGHAGERCLENLTGGVFCHNKQSLRVVDLLEGEGKGLNLTFEVRDGIVNHTKSGNPKTLEGRVVHLADRIAYVNHDIDDAVRAKIITINDLPEKPMKVLGRTHSERINTLITSVYKTSFLKPAVNMADEVAEASEEIRNFMFKNVYLTPDAVVEEEKIKRMLTALFDYYNANPDKLPKFYIDLLMQPKTLHGEIDTINYKKTIICDYISTMTDTYALREFTEIFMPISFNK